MTALQRDKAGLTAGLRVAVHAHAAAAIDLAVAIGVETLEHATYVTPGRHPVGDSISASLSQQATYEQLDALAASGAHVCPTLGGFTPELFEDAPPVLKQRLAESGMTPEEVVGRPAASRAHARSRRTLRRRIGRRHRTC
jgi:imidazolonepropionase-like amidohydrolase